MKRKAEEGHYICENGATKIAKKIIKEAEYQEDVVKELREQLRKHAVAIKWVKLYEQRKEFTSCGDVYSSYSQWSGEKCSICDLKLLCDDVACPCVTLQMCWWCKQLK